MFKIDLLVIKFEIPFKIVRGGVPEDCRNKYLCPELGNSQYPGR